MSDNRIEKNVTDYMISESNSSPMAIKAAENIMECKGDLAIINRSYRIAYLYYVLVINSQEDVKNSLLNIIQSMGEYLVHEDDSIRAKGIYSLL
jgi:hypothetical protein